MPVISMATFSLIPGRTMWSSPTAAVNGRCGAILAPTGRASARRCPLGKSVVRDNRDAWLLEQLGRHAKKLAPVPIYWSGGRRFPHCVSLAIIPRNPRGERTIGTSSLLDGRPSSAGGRARRGHCRNRGAGRDRWRSGTRS